MRILSCCAPRYSGRHGETTHDWVPNKYCRNRLVGGWQDSRRRSLAMKKSVIGMSMLAVMAALSVGLTGCEKKPAAPTKKPETKAPEKAPAPPSEKP